MSATQPDDIASSPRPATSTARPGGRSALAWLGYVLCVGAMTALLLTTTAQSQAQGDKAPADKDKAPRKLALNLLSIFDPLTDVVRGKWSKTGKMLRCDDQHFVPRVQLRYEPPEEYDFYIQFSQPKLRHPIGAIMPNRRGGTFVWQVGLHNGNDYRLQADPAKDWTWKAPKLIKINTLHTTVVQVRRNSIRCLLDGRELVNRQTNFKNLTTDVWNKMPDPSVLGVACDDPTVFHKVLLVEISGRGKVH